jgi:hypothetical protein
MDMDEEEEDHNDDEREDDDVDDEEVPNQDEDDGSFNGDGMISDGEVAVQDGEPYEANDYIITTSKIVRSRLGELLMVRRQTQVPPFSSSYTLEVEVFKADLDAGEWVLSADDGLAEDEALFLSRSFCRSTHVYGDISAGFIYFADTGDVFDTRCRTCRPFRLPPHRRLFSSRLWIFPPELVV